MKHDEILQAAKEATNNQPIYGRKEFTFSAEELHRVAAIIEKRTIERCAAYLTSGSYMVLNPLTTYTAEQHVRALKAHDKFQAAAIRKLGEQ